LRLSASPSPRRESKSRYCKHVIYVVLFNLVALEKARLCMRTSQVLRGQISTLRGECFRACFARISGGAKVHSVKFYVVERFKYIFVFTRKSIISARELLF